MRIVVLGVGNILLTDEGIGVRAIEELGRRYQVPAEVDLLDGGTSAMELLDDLANCNLLIIADCVRAGRAPGTLLRLKDEEIPALFRTKLSPHQVGLPDVLATLVITHEAPEHTVLFGVEPESLATHMGLTPIVEAVLPVLVDAIAAEIAAAGIAIPAR
ncbi:HyaD/HybD family hydrogenase maturation endopeptidase [Parasulfuritortus cantonensis]|uniref:HyaD/HybD family hydrogenase maturation endopeptidase n=1 Tax=Parasulfuritortus cantonensis TaxID=2528202 RepID=A0A4R1BGC6_9PROT|nr:HyaD/HybD family hydrogenase maturation endopeptidase [Parasulfuritortus cantonensis]TCJ16276.1 HyaD/HybD family hydrogenase maturation endopeptidase [Parasulfuritortus cantonensis]